MQLDFADALTTPQPKRRADPARAALLRKEAHRRKLLADPVAASLIDRLRFSYIAAIAELSDAEWNWIARAHRAGMVARTTTDYFNRPAWQGTNKMRM